MNTSESKRRLPPRMATSSRRPAPACCFTLDHFLDLLELPRHFVQWLVTTLRTRAERRAINTKALADDAVTMLLELRAWQLRD
jgi:hypothetical protein